MHIPHIKPVLIGVAGTALTLYIISRLLPGVAVRVGLLPRPVHAAQIGWYEPFGLKPLSALVGGGTTSNGGRVQQVRTSEWSNVYGNGG